MSAAGIIPATLAETCSFIPDQPFLRAKKQAVSPVFPALTTFYRKTQKLSSDNVAENVVYGSFLAKMKEACAKCRKIRRHKNFCTEWDSSPGFQIISFQIRPKNNFTARCCSCSTCGTNHSRVIAGILIKVQHRIQSLHSVTAKYKVVGRTVKVPCRCANDQAQIQQQKKRAPLHSCAGVRFFGGCFRAFPSQSRCSVTSISWVMMQSAAD